MTTELVGQLTFVIVILCSCVISAAFMMYSPVSGSARNKVITTYFSLFFFFTCFAFSFYLFRPFISEPISIFIANIFFISNIYALRFGLLWRQKPHIHMYQCKWTLLHIGLFVVTQLLLYAALDDSQFYRAINHALNTVIILVLTTPLIYKNSDDEPTFGERSLKVAFTFCIFCLLVVPPAYLLLPSSHQFLSVVLLLQVLSVLMMMGGLQSLLMSDTINVHYEMSIRDPLTGIFNRRYFFDCVNNLEMNIDDKPHSVIMCDIDFFKRINDTYGHDIGDQVIIEIAQAITRHAGELGIAARFGGEEFTVLLKNHGLKNAIQFAEELRSLIRGIRVNTPKGQIRVTASFGVAEVWDIPDIDLTIKFADQALLEAKANGRNQVCPS